MSSPDIYPSYTVLYYMGGSPGDVSEESVT